jgi:choline kinase
MNAIILAAGYGKRILSVTKKIPKCLIKVNNEAILIRWIKILKKSGIKKILINLHYKKNLVLQEVKKYNFSGLKIVH